MENKRGRNNFTNEIQCGDFVFFILKYLENLFGFKKMSSLVEELGISIEYLQKSSNWVSYDYYSSLLEMLVNVTHDKNAPFKAFQKESKTNFFGSFYLGYPLNYLNEKSASTRLKLLILLSKKIGNIGKIIFLVSRAGGVKIKIQLNKDKIFNKNFALALKGLISSILLDENKSFYRIKSKEMNNNTYLFEIHWSKITYFIYSIPFVSFFMTSFSFLFLALLALELLSIIKVAHIFSIVMFLFFGLHLLFRIIKEKKLERLSMQDYLFSIEVLKKIEEDHNKQNSIIMDLSENNRVLSIINKIGMVSISTYFNTTLFEIAKILLRELNFLASFYFQFSPEKEKFEYLFELSSKDIDEIATFAFKDFIEENLKSSDFSNLTIEKHIFNLSDFLKKYRKDEEFKLPEYLDNYKIFVLPIDIQFQHKGFFIFLSEKTTFFTDELINKIFEKVQHQVKNSYQSMSTRKIIEEIISNIPTHIVIFDTEDLKIKFANNIFYSSFPTVINRFTKDEIIDSDLLSVLELSKEEEKQFFLSLKNLYKKDRVNGGTIKSGNTIFEFLLFKIDENNPYSKVAGILITDITEAKYFQQQLLLNEKLISLGKLASGISHEINNPLYGILANAEEIAREKNISKKSKKYANEIVDFVAMISGIIRDLSSYSKTLRGEELSDVDINEAINDSINMLKYSKSFLDIKIIKRLSILPTIRARKGELQQVFINLFNNAIQAMNSSGRLTITSKLKEKENSILVTISDTGCGIKEEDKKHIFELFFTTKKEEGSGQGLHITKKILDRYNCNIDFESKEGEGTTFYLTFKL